MTQEDIQLLLKDLCARLPYKVKIQSWYGEIITSDLNTFPLSMEEMDKEELLKAIEQKRQAIRPTDTGEMKTGTVPNKIYYLEQGWLNALKWMEDLINSLPTEPNEDLNIDVDR